MIESLHQLVPSEWCLQCRGCCRFPNPEDAQTPTLSPEEVQSALAAGGRPDWFQPVAPAPSHGVRVVPHASCGTHCPALHLPTNRCTIYAARPLDCQIYPYVVTRDLSGERLLLAVDPKCPYVQQIGPSPVVRDVGLYLSRLLEAPEGQAMLQKNPALAGRWREEFLTIQPLHDPQAPTPAPAPPGFSPLVDHAAAFEGAVALTGRPLSAYHRAAWWPWRDLLRLWWGRVGGTPCVVAEQAGGYFLPLPPLAARMTRDTVAAAFHLLDHLNHGAAVSRIENHSAEQAAQCRAWGYGTHRIEQEYVCATSEVRARAVAQVGRARETGLVVRPYDARRDAEPCWRLYLLWALRRQMATEDPQARAMLRDGALCHRRWLGEAEALGVFGVVAETPDEIHGYLLAVPLSEETVVVLAGIVNQQVPGAAALMTEALCRQVQQPWINLMGDAGLVSLAHAKQAERPTRVVDVYAVTSGRRDVTAS